MELSHIHQVAIMGAIGTKAATLYTLSQNLPIELPDIRNALEGLNEQQFIEQNEGGAYRLSTRGRLFFTHDVSDFAAPILSHNAIAHASFEQRVWDAIRLYKKFGFFEIHAMAVENTDLEYIDELELLLARLCEAGYITRCLTYAKTWVLINDTGSKAPHYYDHTDAFEDQNSFEIIPLHKGAL